MKISSNTLTVLKNFASINSNLVIDAGSTIKTISEPKTILGVARVSEKFDKKIGIYDLNRFLSLIGLFNDPTLDFKDDHVVISSSEKSCHIGYSEPSILTYPAKDISLPANDVEVAVTQSHLNEIFKAAGIFRFSKIRIQSTGNGQPTTISVFDDGDQDGDDFKITLDHKTEKTFDIHFSISNLKLIPGDYKVSISSKFISKWESKSTALDIHYFVAVDKTSTFGE
jgi:hypothetical protein